MTRTSRGLALAALASGAAVVAVALSPAAAVARSKTLTVQLPPGSAPASSADVSGDAGPAPGDTADDGNAAAASSDAAPGPPPATHTVRRGDTLWDISQSYFRDPWRWPKVWALNPEITNPHWIFPGQTVRLRDGGAGAVVTVAAEPDAAPASDTVAVAHVVRSRRPPAETNTPQLRQIGFVDEGSLKSAGVINGSLEEKVMLATGDHAYVEFPNGPPKSSSTLAAHAAAGGGGARYSVYQVDTSNPIRTPGSDLVLGYLVHVCGEVVLDGAPDRKIANARLVDLSEPVERGFRVGPLLRQMKAVAPKKNDADMAAHVVAAVAPNLLIANQMFVVLDRGRRHGVAVGNRFLVLRQGDGLKRVMETSDTADSNFPAHAIAEVLAVDVENETTVGWVSRGTRELRVGDVAELHKGY